MSHDYNYIEFDQDNVRIKVMWSGQLG